MCNSKSPDADSLRRSKVPMHKKNATFMRGLLKHVQMGS